MPRRVLSTAWLSHTNAMHRAFQNRYTHSLISHLQHCVIELHLTEFCFVQVHVQAVAMQNALTSIPHPTSEHTVRCVALKLGTCLGKEVSLQHFSNGRLIFVQALVFCAGDQRASGLGSYGRDRAHCVGGEQRVDGAHSLST